MKNIQLVAFVFLFLTSCGIQKRSFDTPELGLELNEDYLTGKEDSLFKNTEPVIAWWQGFKDPILDSLILKARSNNLDINAAIANFYASRAGLKSTKFDRFPTVDANGSFIRQRLGENVFVPGTNPTYNQYNGGFDAFWELDLFGRVTNRIRGVKAKEQASLADMRSIYLSIFAEVARNYIELRGTQNQLKIAKENLASQQETFELTTRLTNAGTSNSLDVSRAKAQLESTRATIPPLNASITAIINRISVLVGKTPGTLTNELEIEQPIPSLPGTILAGNASDFLRRRPDIFKAEAILAQQIARYNISVADLYPKIAFGGGIGYSAIDIDNFGSKPSFNWNLTPTINWAAFNLGRVKKNIDQQDAFTLALVNQYEKTVLSALEEIKTTMNNYALELERQIMLKEAAKASAEAATYAKQRFEAGLDDFLDYLNAERTLLLAQNELAVSQTLSATNLISVYKALGGGWQIINKEEVDNKFQQLKIQDISKTNKSN
ncbi:TolC family protein [uncultured Aquimarina sp.]|uniref:efflux transporter outer membrane subunit n=1 Tax=uncultured Aquimarina sp. TaxID=575652 RepID=UPI002631DDE1|nr:TolC family protein [uncultured Aquimarina sp.]